MSCKEKDDQLDWMELSLINYDNYYTNYLYLIKSILIFIEIEFYYTHIYLSLIIHIEKKLNDI